MATTNKLGDQSFVSMTLPPPTEKKQLSFETRTGVDGYMIWQTGTRGQPYTVDTFADYADMTSALEAQVGYEAMQGTVVSAEWASNKVLDRRVVVADVTVTEIADGTLGVGGLVGGKAFVKATWELLTVE